MLENKFNINGLTDKQVTLASEKSGKNQLNYKQEKTVLDAVISLAKEPMIILLLVASLIHFSFQISFSSYP
jgi:Ca2+-transporting ATPase